MKKCAILSISYELFKKTFNIPDDIIIAGVESLPEDFKNETFSVKVYGGKLFETPEGQQLVCITPDILKERYNDDIG